MTGLLDPATLGVVATVSDPVILALAGFVAGVLGGMVGIGGGILIVPVLLYTQDAISERGAIATSLAAMVPMSIAAATRHHHYGNLRLHEGLALGVLGIAGAAVGATLAEVLPETVLRVGFALIMVVIAGQMLRGVWRERQTQATAAPD